MGPDRAIRRGSAASEVLGAAALVLLLASAFGAEPPPAMFGLPGVGWSVAEPAGFKLATSARANAEWERRTSRRVRLAGKERAVLHLERIRARVRPKAPSGGRWHTCGAEQVGRTVQGREKGRTYYSYTCLRGETGWESAPFQYYDLVVGSARGQYEVFQLIYEHHWRPDPKDWKGLSRGWRPSEGGLLPSLGLLRRMQKSIAPRRVGSDDADSGGDGSDQESEDSDAGAAVNLQRKAPLLR